MKKILYALPLIALTTSAAMAQSATTPPYTPQVGPSAGDFEVKLSGAGISNNSFDANAFGAAGSLGWYGLDWLEIGLQQNVAFGVGSDVKDQIAGTSFGFVDLVAPLNRWRPYIGATLGVLYGSNDVDTEGLWGLRGGVKYYVAEATFIDLGGSYTPTFNEAFDDAVLNYTLGVGFNF
jgi:hypothetical protein